MAAIPYGAPANERIALHATVQEELNPVAGLFFSSLTLPNLPCRLTPFDPRHQTFRNFTHENKGTLVARGG